MKLLALFTTAAALCITYPLTYGFTPSAFGMQQITALREVGANEELIAAVTETLSDPLKLRRGVQAHARTSHPNESKQLAPVALGIDSESASRAPKVASQGAGMRSTTALSDAARKPIFKNARHLDLLAESPRRPKIGPKGETHEWALPDGRALCMAVTIT